jgi:CBS domain-containing protein
VPDPTGVMLRPLAVMMRREIQAIGPDATLEETARRMQGARVGALWVTERDAFIGVITEADLVRKAMAEGLNPAQEKVRRVMSSPVITIEIDRSAHDASDLMAEKGVRHLAVTHENRIVGTISVRDLLRYFKNWGSL